MSDIEKHAHGPPAEVKKALNELTPKQAAAVRAYTQRGSRAFGNKAESCRVAGYSENTNTSDVFDHDGVQKALRAVRAAKLEKSNEVMEEIQALAPEAREEIMSQLEVGRELGIIDPRMIFGEELEHVSGKDDHSRLKEINKHNRVVAHLAKERRAAAELLLAYAEGTPEQRMRVTREAGTNEVEAWLDSMDREEFEELREYLFGDGSMEDEMDDGARKEADKKKTPKGGEPSGVEDVDYEIVE